MKFRTLKAVTRHFCGKFSVVVALMTVALANARADYQSTVLGDHPLAYYPLNLDVDTGSTATDISGNGNNGTYINIYSGYNNSPNPTPFISGGASFDGQTTYVELGTNSNLDFSGQITLEAWVQPTNSTEGPADIIGKGPDSSQDLDEVEMRANAGNFTGGVYNNTRGGQGASGGTQSTNWSYVAITYDGTNWNMYVNGQLTQANADTVGAIAFVDPWRIGSGSSDYGSSRLFAGNISQVAMYNHGLTPAQVFAHYFVGEYGSLPGNSVPIITAQPAPQVGHIGGSATFNVSVLSVLPVTNQWFKNSTPITGQTNSTLTLANLQSTDVANYSVVVGNSNGTTNSIPAGLTLKTLSLYESTVLNDKPQGYYPLDPSIDTGTVATDLSGNGFNAVFNNTSPGFDTVTGPTANITNAAYFSGTTYADIGNIPQLNFGGQITLEAWVQPANTGKNLQDILAKGYDGSLNDAEIALRQDFTDFNALGLSGGTAQVGTWAYVAATYDGNNYSLYVNGVLVSSSQNSSGVENFSDAWRIGSGSADGSSRLFNGDLSQVALYNYGLSAAQVADHYFVAEYGISPSNSLPIITAQPTPQTAYAGSSAEFTFSVLSLLPVTEQWLKNGSPIAGQTNAQLILFNVQPGDAANYSVAISNSNGTTNSVSASLTLATFTAPNIVASLKWSASGNNGSWDNATANWINLANSQTVDFAAGDSTLFDDTTGVPTNVVLNDTVSPSYITNNSSANSFTFSGSGSISGPATLVKSGGSTLEIQSANTFTGPVIVNGGELKADSPLNGSATTLGANFGSAITVANGATLAVNVTSGNTGISDPHQIIIAGTGVGGNGALQSVGNDVYHDGGGLFRLLTLSGDATIGGPGRWDVGTVGEFTAISTTGHNYNLTCLEGNYSEWHEVTIDPALGNIDFFLPSANSVNFFGMGQTGLGNPAGILTLHPGVNLTIGHEIAGGDNGYAKIIHVETNAQFSYRPNGGGGDYHIATSLQLDGGAQWNFYNGDGGNGTGVTVGGTVTLNGLTFLSIGNSPITFTNVISGTGGFVWQTYDHTVTFSANDTYTGPTILCDGRTLELSGNGAISQSTNIFFGGTDSTSERMDVSERTDHTLTLIGGQTLGGIGLINGALTVSAGADISPAGTNITLGITAGSSSTGTIAASGAVTLGGTTTIKLNGPGTNDVIQSTGAGIAYGGTLNLVNISAAPLAAGNSFQIFMGTGNTSAFAHINPTTPGNGLTWNTSQLSSGIISVAGPGSAKPVINSFKISGGNVVLSGSNGTASAGFYIVTSTNATTPLAQWKVVSTNSYDVNGNFNVTNAITPGNPQGFYLLKSQ